MTTKTNNLAIATSAFGSNAWYYAQFGLVAVMFALIYHSVMWEMVMDWYTYDIYSYGFLVPIISIYLIWRKLPEIRKLPHAPSLGGCLFLAVAVGLYFVGFVATDSFVMRVSLVLSLIGLTYLIFGWQTLSALSFPLCYLFLMIPFPYSLGKAIRTTMMFLDAKHSASVLQLLGIPVFLESNFLHLPHITLEVAEICSGLSSIFALFVLGIFFAYFLPIPLRFRALLAAVSVPLAMLINLVRIILTVILTFWFGPAVLQSTFHMLTGTFNFLLSVFLLLAFGEFLRKRYRMDTSSETAGAEARPAPAAQYAPWVGCLLGFLILGGTAIGKTILSQQIDIPLRLEIETLPRNIESYAEMQKGSVDGYTDANAERAFSRVYQEPNGLPIEIFVGYRGSNTGATRLQSPKLIQPKGGSYVWLQPATVDVPGSLPINGAWLLTQQGPKKFLVLYWYQSGGQTFAGEIYYRWMVFKQRMLHWRSDMAVVRIVSPFLESESVEAAKARLLRFAVRLPNHLNTILPGPNGS